MEKQYLTKLEAADLLGISERTVHSLIRSEKLKSVKAGRSVRITHEAIAEYLGQKNGKKVSPPALRENEIDLAEKHIERWLDDMAKSEGSLWYITETPNSPSRCDCLDRLEQDFSDLVKRLRRKSCMSSR